VTRFKVAGGDIAGAVSHGRSAFAVLFLHGWTLDRRMWTPQMAAFGDDYRCVSIDRRGFGESTAPADISAECDDVIAILDEIGVARAVIVGMSQSGRIAAETAINHTPRVAGLVLHGARIGAHHDLAGEAEIPLDHYRALAREGRLAEMKAEWRAHPLMRADDAEASALVDAMLADYDARDLLCSASAPAALDAASLADLAIPILILTGDQDTPLRRRLGDELASAIPGAQRAEIAGAGHLCNISAASEYNRILGAFLALASKNAS